MVVSEILRAQLVAAVLTLKLIAGIDVLAGELYIPFLEAYEAKQAHNGGNPHGAAHRTNDSLGLLHNLDLASEDELDGSLPVDDVQRFERSI